MSKTFFFIVSFVIRSNIYYFKIELYACNCQIDCYLQYMYMICNFQQYSTFHFLQKGVLFLLRAGQKGETAQLDWEIKITFAKSYCSTIIILLLCVLKSGLKAILLLFDKCVVGCSSCMARRGASSRIAAKGCGQLGSEYERFHFRKCL